MVIINTGCARVLGVLLLASSLFACGMDTFSDALSGDFGGELQNYEAPELQGSYFIYGSDQPLDVGEFQNAAQEKETGEAGGRLEDVQLESAERLVGAQERLEIVGRDYSQLEQPQLIKRGVKRKSQGEKLILAKKREKNFPCYYPDCAIRCGSPCSLEAHLRVHTGERPFKCELCGRGFKQKEHLTIHMVTHSLVVERPFVCGHCDKGFKYKSNLNEHIKTHDTEEKWECELCHKLFKQKSYLRKHTKKHCLPPKKTQKKIIPKKQKHDLAKKQEEFFCDICQLSFKIEKWYTRHMNEHLRIMERDRIDMLSQAMHNVDQLVNEA